MKKLTLKQVALGLLIAGYSISGAYAADTVSTQTDFILGHAPLVNSTIQQSFSKNSVDIKVVDGNGIQIADNAEVKNGYTIQLTYKLADQDGDTDPGLETASTVKFAYMKRNTTDYIWVTAGTPTTGANGEVTVSWTIPAAAIGSKIYYAIIPKTKYGNPNQSTKEVYGNVFKKTDAGSREVTQTGTNIPNDGVDSGTGGGQTPNVTDDTIQPDGSTFAITIYEATINNGAVAMNTELNPSSKPEVGKTYAAKVTLSQNGTQDITTQFKYTWSLVDFDGNKIGDPSLTSQPVDNVQASTVNYQDSVSSSAQAVTNIAYTIPVNDQVKKADGSAVTGLFAGAQGYKLKVEAEAL